MKKISALAVGFCSLLVVTATMSAQDGPLNHCPTHIKSCGCLINRNDIYVVDNDLNANQTKAPNCIEIEASGAKLNLKSHKVTGNGNGIGILIRHGADHVIVHGADNAGTLLTSEEDSCNLTAQAVVTGWNVAIEDDGDYAMIELFSQLGGSKGPNATAGILMNEVTGSVASDFIACGNGTAGIIVRNSSGVSISNYTADGNDHSLVGTWLDNSHDCALATGTNVNNINYGFLLMRSSRNVIANANATAHNGDTGILIGCGTEHCTDNETSENNRVTNAGATQNVNAGIMIQKENRLNIIANTTNSGNGKTDLVDLNKNCDKDNWYNNLGTRNQSCIH